MKKRYFYGITLLTGSVYGLAILFLSRFIIRNLSGLFSGISAITGIAASEKEYIVQILDQLKKAHIISP